MLLLQLTDGVQNLEAMEYQSVPALNAALRPGAKVQLQGQMVCRLGVLLLGPSNIKVLGGEVEDLVDRNNQARVLCRTLGLPEEEEQQHQQQEVEEAPPAPHPGNQEMDDLELDDAELLASLEAQEQVERVQLSSVQDSGYGTHSEISTQSSRSSSHGSHVSTASSRGALPQSNRGGLVQGHRHSNEREDSDHLEPFASDNVIHQEIPDHDMAEEDFPDEDFDDFPLDELDAVILQESATGNRRSMPQSNWATEPSMAQFEQRAQNASGSRPGSVNSRSIVKDIGACARGATGLSRSVAATSSSLLSPAASEQSRELEYVTNDEGDFMNDGMDCFPEEVQSAEANELPVQQGPSDPELVTKKAAITSSSWRLSNHSSKGVTPQGQSDTSGSAEFDRLSDMRDPQSRNSDPALTLTSPPFTYLCLLQELMSRPCPTPATEIRVKAFIVTLLGKLTGSNGVWRVCATISDGTGYLDVELSDEVLTGLLGFSVAEKGVLKRDPTRRDELNSGMRRCQEELVDMCCVMTIAVEAEGRKATVMRAEPVNENVLQELEQRVKDRRK
ncbi:uncharacterized protein V6R79_002999 [Siganus canaliculatus]